MKYHLLATSAVCGFAFFAALPAYAACTAGPYTNGQTITCSGTADGIGVDSVGTNNTTVTVSDVVSNNSTYVFRLGNNTGMTIQNGGSVTSTAPAGTDAIFLNSGSTFTLDNGGALTHTGGTALELRDNSTATINGTLTGDIKFSGAGTSSASVTIGSSANMTGNIDYSILHADHRIDLAGTQTGTVTADGTNNLLEIVGGTHGSFNTDDIGTKYIGFDSFTQAGAGVTTLTGTNAQNWNVTAGALQTSDLANINNLFIDSGGVADFNGVSGTYSGDLSGGGQLFIVNGSSLSASGDNSGFTGALFLSSGSDIIFSNAGSFGFGSFIRLDDATLTFANDMTLSQDIDISNNFNSTIDTTDRNVTFSGDIQGVGGPGQKNLVKTGTGTLTLAGNSSFYDDLFLNQGAISIGALANLGASRIKFDGGTLETTASMTMQTISILNAGGGTFQVDAGTVLTEGAAMYIVGAGDLTKTGAGTLLLNDASGVHSNSGNVVILGGIIDAADNAVLGDASGTNNIVMSNGTLRWGGSYTQTRDISLGVSGGTLDGGAHTAGVSGDISGTGNLTIANGAFTLSGTNSNSGKVTIGNGGAATTVNVDASSRLGDASATNDLEFADATLRMNTVFDQARDIAMTGDGTISFDTIEAAITGNLSGAGTLTKDGTGGTLVITGDHSNTGNIVINSGAIALEDATDRSYGGIISGAGDFSKGGAGTLVLTNTSTITGATSVYGGKLVVNGSLGAASSFSATGAGTTLGGNGTVRNADFASGTILAPGNSIGTMHVNGTLALNNGVHYQVQYDPASADNTIATGAITLGATSVLDLSGAGGVYEPTHIYTILQGASVSGTFGTVNNNLAFLDPSLAYNPADVQLTMTRNGTEFSDIAEDQSQAETANAITGLGAGNEVFDTFSGLTASQARDALDQLSGEHNAGIGSGLAESNTMIQDMLTSHINGLAHSGDTGEQVALGFNAGESGMAAGDGYERQSAWLEAIGTSGHSDAQGSASSQDRSSYGTLFGYDASPFEDGHAGLFGGYERGSIDTNSENANSDLNNYHLGAYASYPALGLNISGAIHGTYHDIETNRTVSYPGFSEKPHGDTNGYTVSGFAEVSKPFDTGMIAIEPFINASLTHSHVSGYTETGGGTADLAVGDITNNNPATVVGARFGKSFKGLQLETFTVSTKLGWRHTYGSLDTNETMRFASGSTAFDTSGAPLDRNAVDVGLNLGFSVNKELSCYAGYTGTLSRENQDHAFKIGLKWAF